MIDLDPYTDIGVDPGTGAIVLGPGAGAAPGLRNFYFRPEDRQIRAMPPLGGDSDSNNSSSSTSASASVGGRSRSRGRWKAKGTARKEYVMGDESGGETGEGDGRGGQKEGEGGEGGVGGSGGRGGGVGAGMGEGTGEEGGGGGGVLGDWLSGLHRERYKVVRDERDAYMNLQVTEPTGRMESTICAYFFNHCCVLLCLKLFLSAFFLLLCFLVVAILCGGDVLILILFSYFHLSVCPLVCLFSVCRCLVSCAFLGAVSLPGQSIVTNVSTLWY